MDEIIILSKEAKRFWGTTKTKARVHVVNRPVRCWGTYWSGGSRNSWWTQSKLKVVLDIPNVGPAPFDNREAPDITPTHDTALVQGGTCNGKEAMLTIYVTSKAGWTW